MKAVPPPPKDDSVEQRELERKLRDFVFKGIPPKLRWYKETLLLSLPLELRVILHEDFLPTLSKSFKDAAHDGPFEKAIWKGLTLLAVYMVVYPAYFPQTGANITLSTSVASLNFLLSSRCPLPRVSENFVEYDCQ